MSVGVQTWVFQQSESTGNDRLVLLAIADEADDDGTNAYPSIETIARKARVNRATAIRAIRRLEEQSELVVHRPETHGRGKFNVYVVLMGRSAESVADCNPFDEARAKARNGRRKARKGAETSRQVQPNPKTLEPEDPKTTSTAAACDDAQPDNAGLILRGFIDWCDEHKKPRPANPGHLGKVIRQLMDAGHQSPAIKQALVHTVSFTLPGLELQLRRECQVRQIRPTRTEEQLAANPGAAAVLADHYAARYAEVVELNP